MDFGGAIRAMKGGKSVCRRSWRKRGMMIFLQAPVRLPPASSMEHARRVDDVTASHIGRDVWLDAQAHFVMRTPTGTLQPGWVAGQADMLAEDWERVDGERGLA